MLLVLPVVLFGPEVCRGQSGERKSPEFFGDFRLRSEYNANRDGGLRNRFRERIRLRVAARYEISDYVTVAARFVTGDPDDPNSTHQTLGTTFNKVSLTLDQAYVNLRLKEQPLWIRAGKFRHPFRTSAVYKELVWDADVHPEGVSAGYSFGGPKTHLGAVAAYYLLAERNDATDASSVAGQVYLDVSNRSYSIAGALGGYRYSRIKDDNVLFRDNAGNAGVAQFASNFAIVDAFVNVVYKLSTWSPTVSAQFVKNVDAEVDDDTGVALGASLSRTKGRRSVKLYYQYQVIEQDAVFSPFSQDDFLAQTNFNGHVLGLRYGLSRKISINLWGLVSKRKSPSGGNHQTRLRADLDVSL